MNEENVKVENAVENENNNPSFFLVSKIIIFLGAILTAVGAFLPLINTLSSGTKMGAIYLKGSESVGLHLTASFTLPKSIVFLPVCMAVVIAILTILAKQEKKLTAYIAGVLGALMLIATEITYLMSMKFTLTLLALVNNSDTASGIGYYLLLVGYLLVIGGAVSCKGLDSISAPDEEEEISEDNATNSEKEN